MRSIRRWRVVEPYLLWCGSLATLSAVSAVLIGNAGADFDFVRNGAIQAHVTERSLMPILVAQNGPRNMPILLVLTGCYWLAYAAYERSIRLAISARWATIVFGAGAAAMLCVPFFPTTDPYAYALYALESGPLGLDPYASHALLGGGLWERDLLHLFPSASAPVRICNYGPAFVFAYATIGSIFRSATLGTFLIVERCCGIVAIVVTAIALAFAVPGEAAAMRVKRAVTFALHPLILLEFVAFAHGDALMLGALALAYAAMRRGRFGAAGALCAIAVATRVVAILALVALLSAAFRAGSGPLRAALTGAMLFLAGTCVASLMRFHAVAFGGPPVYDAFSAPLLALASTFRIPDASRIGLALEAAFGVAAAACVWRAAMRGSSRTFGYFPLAALAGSPSLYAHYFTWFLPIGSLTSNPRMGAIARALSLVAPLLYIVHMDPFAAASLTPAVQIGVLAIVWLPVVAAVAGPPSLSRTVR